MGQKDLLQKELLSFEDVFADTVNALAHEGKEILNTENLLPGATETVYPAGEEKLHSQMNDVCKYWCENRKIKAQYLLENQSKKDRRMIFRKAGYIGAAYREMYQKDDEYPVILLVLHWGNGGWTQPGSLKEELKVDQLDDSVAALVDDMKLTVYEMAKLPKQIRERFHSDMRIIVDYLAERGDYKPTKQKIKHVEAFLRFMKEITHTDWYEKAIPQMLQKEKEEGEVTMCELLERYWNEGMEAGMERGESRFAALSKYLLTEGKAEELLKAAQDREYLRKLYLEYQL